ncbi:ISSod13, transposase [Wolbachia endosymbiont of Drosophila ananassae]|nr:ISSod13, transposase [Wolbachia endosymbiont of Drosophila ananassae]
MKEQREAHGEIETQHPGYLGSQDTYYVGNIKGIGRIYQQTFVDTYSRVAMVKLYTDRTAITAADLLNDRVIPFFDEQKIPLLRILTDRGTEYCGKPENHACNRGRQRWSRWQRRKISIGVKLQELAAQRQGGSCTIEPV